MITAQQLASIMPRCPAPVPWAEALNYAARKFHMDDRADVWAEFLGQLAHESNELNRLEESLNYRAERLMQVWPKRFPTLAVASKYAGSPHALANFVYANRMGNGDEASGDGWKYRGRGPIMLTGKKNYEYFAKVIGDPLLATCPDRAMTKDTGAQIAVAFWMHDDQLSQLARDTATDDDEADFISISRIVNGGTVGLDARRVYRDRAKAVLT
jgi:putative chitinase